MQGLFCTNLGKPCSVRLSEWLGRTVADCERIDMRRFSDYWPMALAVQLLTMVLIGFAAWMNWKTYEHRKALTLQVEELEKKVQGFEESLSKQTMPQRPKRIGQ